jgi:hypothetical protein
MPTYDFYCEKCDKKVEIVRSIKDDSEVPCPECKTKMWQQLSINEHVVFKGDGWARKPKLGD